MNPIILFTVGKRPFSVGDTLEFALSQGLLQPLVEEIAEGLACRQYALELGFELPARQLQRAVEAWRYKRKLTSASETMDWLRRSGLSVEDLSDHFEIRLWSARFSSERKSILAEYPPAREEVERRLPPAAIIGDSIRSLARSLAWRAAALVECHGVMPERPLRELLPEMESCFRQLRDRAVTRESCRGEVAAARFALMQVECEAASFPDRDQAQEAVFCVREDGEEIEAVCARARAPVERGRNFIDGLAPEIRDRCLSASAGELFVAPQPGGTFRVVRLLRKIEPELADEAVRSRVEKRLTESTFSQCEARHVQWKDW
jgi:hypothetical protein